MYKHATEFHWLINLGWCRDSGVHNTYSYTSALVQRGDNELGMIHAFMPAGIWGMCECG